MRQPPDCTAPYLKLCFGFTSRKIGKPLKSFQELHIASVFKKKIFSTVLQGTDWTKARIRCKEAGWEAHAGIQMSKYGDSDRLLAMGMEQVRVI